MRNVGIGIVTALGIFAFLFSTVSSDALVTLNRDTTDIGKIMIVSPEPGDSPIANGTALINALNGITDASPTNQYVLKLGPGIYDVQGTSVQMKEYVDIEGSGENTTKITGASSTEFPPTQATVQGANNAEIRFLSVENTGNTALMMSIAILNSSASPSLLHITASASGGNSNFGIWNTSSSSKITNVTATGSGGLPGKDGGVQNYSSSPTMTNVTASGYGDQNCGVCNISSSSPIMRNVIATGSGGTFNNGVNNTNSSPTMTNVTTTALGTNSYGVFSGGGGVVKINNSVVSGITNTISNGSGVTTLVGNSQLDGGPVSNVGTLTCVGAYNTIYAPLSNNCQ